MGFDLISQWYNAVVRAFVLYDACKCGFDIHVLDQQAHAAAQLTLDAPWCRSNPVFDAVFQQQIPQGQTLLVINKHHIPAKIRISH